MLQDTPTTITITRSDFSKQPTNNSFQNSKISSQHQQHRNQSPSSTQSQSISSPLYAARMEISSYVTLPPFINLQTWMTSDANRHESGHPKTARPSFRHHRCSSMSETLLALATFQEDSMITYTYTPRSHKWTARDIYCNKEEPHSSPSTFLIFLLWYNLSKTRALGCKRVYRKSIVRKRLRFKTN